MIRSKLLVASVAVFGLAAFSSDDALAATAPNVSGATLNEALASGYADLASREYAELDYVDGDAFAAKRDLANAGGNVIPYIASEWDITGDDLVALDAARARIMTAYDKGGDILTPVELATAQVNYDCWVQEIEETINVEDANACRAAYESAIEQVRYPEPKPMPEPGYDGPVAFSVYFDHDSTELSVDAYRDIAEAAAVANKFNSKLVLVGGHTDTSGSSAYNNQLAASRADVVGAALIAEGVNPDLLELSGYGEEQLAVETGDNVRERGNRRAEIELRFE